MRPAVSHQVRQTLPRPQFIEPSPESAPGCPPNIPLKDEQETLPCHPQLLVVLLTGPDPAPHRPVAQGSSMASGLPPTSPAPTPVNYSPLIEIFITWRVREGVLMVKWSRQSWAVKNSCPSPTLAEVVCPGGRQTWVLILMALYWLCGLEQVVKPSPPL